MKNTKKLLVGLLTVGVLSASVAVYAAEVKSPAEIASSLTGKTVTQVDQERAAGKTYGTIAKDAGKLDEFKKQILEQKKANLDQQVKDKKITQAQADTIYNAIKANQATCDGTGTAAIGRKNGMGNGQGSSLNQGRGMGRGVGMQRGAGMGRGAGLGSGMRNGSCLTTAN